MLLAIHLFYLLVLSQNLWLPQKTDQYGTWCRSIFRGGSTAVFMFVYSIYFYCKSNMSGVLQTTIFFVYNTCICYAFFLMLGTISLRASLMFTRHIYHAVKSEWESSLIATSWSTLQWSMKLNKKGFHFHAWYHFTTSSVIGEARQNGKMFLVFGHMSIDSKTSRNVKLESTRHPYMSWKYD